MSTNAQHPPNLEKTPDALTETHESVTTPSVAASPLVLKGTPNPVDIVDMTPRPGPIILRRRLAVHTFLVVVYILLSTGDYPENRDVMFAILAKAALMAVVAYLPGPGPQDFRFEVSDFCQWGCFILSVAISVLVDGNNPDRGLGRRLFSDWMAYMLALTWRDAGRIRELTSMPYRRISALFRRLRQAAPSQGEGFV
ncbi:hypothetical protein C8F01DRAFT_1259679 [Mycena amicta]|nr:hypothetical protein C8F01DRAFT_1259679 [Mycena amicta]